MPVRHPITRESRVIFSSGERGFTAKDVVDCALVRGEIDPLWKEFLRVAECDRLANERELELDDSALDSAAIAFRYKHDLITAEETERWLEDRGVSLAEFSDYFARQYWGRSYSGTLDPPKSSYETASPEEKDLFLVDLILSGSLDRMAERLSYRVAAQADEAGDNKASVDEERARFLAAAKIDQAELADWLAQLGRDQEWLDETLATEAVYQRRVSQILTEQALQKELGADATQSHAFSARDGGSRFTRCRGGSGCLCAERRHGNERSSGRKPVSFHRSEVLLEDIPSEQQQRFLSVKAGTLFDPIPRGDAFEVWRVKTRTEPSLQDPVIRARLESRIVDRCFNELLSKHIDWKFYLPPSE